MKLNITWKEIHVISEAYILIKYGVITDVIKFILHNANIAGETLINVTNGVDEIGGQIERTVDAMNYQTETVAANFSNADKSIIQMSICVIFIFVILRRFVPTLYAMWIDGIRGDTKASKGGTKASRGGKEARFNKWVAKYGGDYKTKKAAKEAFEAFEKDMGYS